MGQAWKPGQPIQPLEQTRGRGVLGLQVVGALAGIGFALWGVFSMLRAAIDLLR